MYEKTWCGDWHARIIERARSLGFNMVTEYAAHRIGAPLIELAHELGPDDVAAAQITCLLVEEAVRTNTVPAMLRDLLVRELREALPAGWKRPLSEELRSEVAGAVSGWYAELQDYLDRDTVVSLGKELLQAELPEGWRPAGPG